MQMGRDTETGNSSWAGCYWNVTCVCECVCVIGQLCCTLQNSKKPAVHIAKKKATRNFISPLTQINGDRFHFAFQSVKRQYPLPPSRSPSLPHAACPCLPHAAPVRGKSLADTPLAAAAASKIICKCQCILTVCGDVFQITIYNGNGNGNGKRKTEKLKYKWKQFSAAREGGTKNAKHKF